MVEVWERGNILGNWGVGGGDWKECDRMETNSAPLNLSQISSTHV